jgi:hypothetical protein
MLPPVFSASRAVNSACGNLWTSQIVAYVSRKAATHEIVMPAAAPDEGCLIIHDLTLPPRLQQLLRRFCEEYGDEPTDVIADALDGHFDALAGATHSPAFLGFSECERSQLEPAPQTPTGGLSARLPQVDLP